MGVLRRHRTGLERIASTRGFDLGRSALHRTFVLRLNLDRALVRGRWLATLQA